MAAAKSIPEAPKDFGWAKAEIDILQADWVERHREIAVRNQSEHSQSLLLVSASLAIAGGLFATRNWTGEIRDALPTLAAVGCALLTVFVANLSVLSVTTELRRHYVQRRLEPRIRELVELQRPAEFAGSDVTVLDFETYDRIQHKPWYNLVILLRSMFYLLLPVLLGVVWFWLRSTKAWALPWWPLEVGLVTFAFAVVAFSIVALSVMWHRTEELTRLGRPREEALAKAAASTRATSAGRPGR